MDCLRFCVVHSQGQSAEVSVVGQHLGWGPLSRSEQGGSLVKEGRGYLGGEDVLGTLLISGEEICRSLVFGVGREVLWLSAAGFPQQNYVAACGNIPTGGLRMGLDPVWAPEPCDTPHSRE